MYDGLGRVVEEVNELGLSRYFEHDLVGNVTRTTDRNGRVVEYGFDNLYRLTSEAWKEGAQTVRTLAWVYDVESRLQLVGDNGHLIGLVYVGASRFLRVGGQEVLRGAWGGQ